MEESKNVGRDAERRHGRRGREQENGRPKKRTDYAAGADGEQDVKAGPSAADDDLFRPQRDDGGSGEGQLGPDEISEPEELVRNNEAKLHH